MSDRGEGSINQSEPRGPGRHDGREDPPDAPPLDQEQASHGTGGSRVGNEARQGSTEPGEPHPGERAAEQGEDPTTAEAVIPALRQDHRLTKGSDPNSPFAGLRAAAASVQGDLDAGAYAAFVAERDEDWPSLGDLEQRYGSFDAALAAAGIAGNPATP